MGAAGGEIEAQLADRLEGNSQRWDLNQIEALLQAANQRLQLYDDPEGARQALELASDAIARKSDPRLFDLRGEIANEVAAHSEAGEEALVAWVRRHARAVRALDRAGACGVKDLRQRHGQRGMIRTRPRRPVGGDHNSGQGGHQITFENAVSSLSTSSPT